MHKTLSSIADIRVGHTFRSKIQHHADGDVPVLQIKDLKNRDSIDPTQLPRLHRQDYKNASTTQAGDVILPARGEHNIALALDTDQPIIVSSQLYILHLKSHELMPEFLAWTLNQKTAQHYFKTHRSGTSIPMLSKQSLGELDISLPPLHTQQKIISIQALWLQEKQLNQQLLNNREIMLTGIFQQLLER